MTNQDQPANVRPTLHRAYVAGQLPSIEFRATEAEAIETALLTVPDDVRPVNLIVERVRTAELGDFFDFSDLASVMSERMASMIGNDDALSRPEVLDAIAKLVDRDIRTSLTAAAGLAGMRIDGFIVEAAQNVTARSDG